MEQMYLALLERSIRRFGGEAGRYCRFPDYTVRITRGAATPKSIITVCGDSVRTPAFRLAECIKQRREEALGMSVFIRPSREVGSPFVLDDRLFVAESELLAVLANCTALGFRDFFQIKSFSCKGEF